MGLDVTIYIPNSAEISLAIKSGVRRDTACWWAYIIYFSK
jgi:hypothetical protein